MRNKRRSDRLEHDIAGVMAVAVVDRLETVEIDVDQRRAGAVALDVSQRALELALETAAVEHVGQRIDVDPGLEIQNARARKLQLRRQRVDLGGKPHDDRARDGGRDAFAASAPACLPVGARDYFGCGRRDVCGLRTDLAALRFIDPGIPEARIAKRG